jgi:hypothetical protein
MNSLPIIYNKVFNSLSSLIKLINIINYKLVLNFLD